LRDSFGLITKKAARNNKDIFNWSLKKQLERPQVLDNFKSFPISDILKEGDIFVHIFEPAQISCL
jgi:hypothetical protein